MFRFPMNHAKLLFRLYFILAAIQQKIEEQMESKRMKQEDQTIRKKKQICDEMCCPCKILSERNKIELDPLFFNISKINSKKYMNDYMKALNISHIFVYL